MLLDAGMAPNSNCATRAIGYRQALDFLAACHAEAPQQAQHAQQGAEQGLHTEQGGGQRQHAEHAEQEQQQQQQLTRQGPGAQPGGAARSQQAQQAQQDTATGALTDNRVVGAIACMSHV